MADINERVTRLESDVEHLDERMTEFKENCIRTQGEIKGLIEKALNNELAHFKKDLEGIKNQLQSHGVPVQVSFWSRVKDPSTIITACISGVVAIIVAYFTTHGLP